MEEHSECSVVQAAVLVESRVYLQGDSPCCLAFKVKLGFGGTKLEPVSFVVFMGPIHSEFHILALR